MPADEGLSRRRHRAYVVNEETHSTDTTSSVVWIVISPEQHHEGLVGPQSARSHQRRLRLSS